MNKSRITFWKSSADKLKSQFCWPNSIGMFKMYFSFCKQWSIGVFATSNNGVICTAAPIWRGSFSKKNIWFGGYADTKTGAFSKLHVSTFNSVFGNFRYVRIINTPRLSKLSYFSLKNNLFYCNCNSVFCVIACLLKSFNSKGKQYFY